MQNPRERETALAGRLLGLPALLVLLAALACSDGTKTDDPAAFCQVLEDLNAGRVDLGSGTNEMAGHVASLDALLAVAPSEIEEDLEQLRDTLADVRDAGGLRTFLHFNALTDAKLAGMEGRIAAFAADQCGVRTGDISYQVDDRPPDATRCEGWPRAGSPLTNNRFPYLLATAAANYFSTSFWSVPFVPAPPGFIGVPRGGSAVFEGEYPYARYFAFHPNDYETNNLETLLDVELDPDEGSTNPWRGEVGPGKGRRYTARLVFGPAPDEPEPNTSYVGQSKGGDFNPLTYVIFRIYGADQGSMPPNSAGVPLPAITTYDEDGIQLEHFPACDPYPPGFVPPVDDTRFPAFPVADYRAVHRAGKFDTNSNWGLPIDILANKDVLYVATPYGRNLGEVMVVRARKPRTPSRSAGVPLWSPDVDIRMWSVCTYNFWNGAANACLTDEQVAADPDGFYTLVITDAAHRPTNAEADGGTWLDGGNFLDGQITWRMLLGENDALLAELRSAIGGDEPSAETEPYVPRSAHCSLETFQAGGWRACFD
jgi:hypothetical protein